MALTAPTADLTGNTIASTYDQLLILDSTAGIVENTLKVVSTQIGKSALQLSDEQVRVTGVDTANAAAFEVMTANSAASIFKIAANTPAITINAATVTLTQDTNFVTSGGVNGMSIDGTTFSVDGTNDRVGIGTATPDMALTVYGPPITHATNGQAQLNVLSTEAFSATPNMGIALGGEYQDGDDTSFAAINAQKENGTSGQNGGYMALLTRANGGNLVIAISMTSAQAVSMPAYANGSVTFSGGTGLVTTSSDERMKKDIETLELDGIAKVNALNPVTYKWREKDLIDGTDVPMYDPNAPNGGVEMGFIAQETSKVIPQTSPDYGDDRKRGIYDRPIIAVLVKAVQELSAKVTALENA